MFHLLQTLSAHTVELDAGVPARGLHGEGYRGHVFWDELFVFPLLSLRAPALTRGLLSYRWRRLDAAVDAARRAGLAGALFPWQSGSDGREETPAQLFNIRSGRWMADNSRLQRHVSLAVAYNAWHYYQVTADVEFLADQGAELIIEVARLFASLAIHDLETDRYDIAGVMGPDEYHDAYPGATTPGLRNNAYTNVLAAWVCCRALDTVRVLDEHHGGPLWERLGVQPVERWDRLSRRLRVPFHDDGIISQFDGYDALAELDWARYCAPTPTSAASTSSSRPRATAPTATSCPSRPTCSCSSTCFPRRARRTVRPARLPAHRRHRSPHRRLLPGSQRPRLDPQPGRARLGARPRRPCPFMGDLHRRTAGRPRRHPGWDHSGGRPPGRHGRRSTSCCEATRASPCATTCCWFDPLLPAGVQRITFGLLYQASSWTPRVDWSWTTTRSAAAKPIPE